MKRLKIYCAECNRETNHEVLHQHQEQHTPENTPEMGIDFAEGTWQIIRCMGCERVSFREYWHTSEDWSPEGPTKGTEYLYPKRGADIVDCKTLYLPPKLALLYHELVDCYNNGLRTACAAIIRTMIEAITSQTMEEIRTRGVPEAMDLKKPTGVGEIEWKVKLLAENGILSKKHAEVLQETRYLGNIALHRLEVPSSDELRKLIRIIEHTLQNLFELSYELERMKSKRESRNKRKPI